MLVGLGSVNLTSVLIAAVLSFILGWLWYSPVLFGNPWTKLNGFTKAHMKAAQKKGMKGMLPQMIFSFLCSAVMIYILGIVLMSIGASTVSEAVLAAFVVWLGFFAATMINMVLWEGKSFSLYLIAIGHHLAVLVLSAVILTLW